MKKKVFRERYVDKVNAETFEEKVKNPKVEVKITKRGRKSVKSDK